MKVLFVASESIPFIKTGGLADFTGSLPNYLKQEGIDIRVVIPNYKGISPKFKEKMKRLTSFSVPVSWREQFCKIKVYEHQNIIYYFVDNKYYFDRMNLYGESDDAERFTFFTRAVLEMLPRVEFQPDIIHCHDWQTGLISLFLKTFYKENAFYKNIKTVFTIHNLKYQGSFPPEILEDVLGLGSEYFNINGLEHYGEVNYMKGSLNFADKITTISRTYAREIQTCFYGEGMNGLLRERSEDLYGIVNGIDYDIYNPSTDPHIFKNYESDLNKKRENKVELQKMLGLTVNKDTPVLVLISRLVEEKGISLLTNILEELLELDLQLIILGTGEYEYEQLYKEVSWRYQNRVSAHITFNEDLARKLYAGGDFLLMPSQYEPCGTGQLIALRYYTLPVVRETGGLQDTVQGYNDKTEIGNGFTFSNYDSRELLDSIKYGLKCYHDSAIFKKILNNIKKYDYSWKKSAGKYIDLYQSLI